MSANRYPIFVRKPDVQWAESMVTANNTVDLTSGTSYLLFAADVTEGGYVKEVTVRPNPAANTAATVFRLWINNGGTTGTASNSAIYKEVSIPATTASASAAQFDIVIPLDLPLPAGYRLFATLGTAPGGSGEFTAVAVGGKY